MMSPCGFGPLAELEAYYNSVERAHGRELCSREKCNQMPQHRQVEKKKKKYVFFGVATTGSSFQTEEIVQIVAAGPMNSKVFNASKYLRLSRWFNGYVKPAKRMFLDDKDTGIKYENGKFLQNDEAVDPSIVFDTVGQALMEFYEWISDHFECRVVLCAFEGKTFHFKFLRRALDDDGGMKELYKLECVDIKEAFQHRIVSLDGYDFQTLANLYLDDKFYNLDDKVYNLNDNSVSLEKFVRLTKELCYVAPKALSRDPARFLWFRPCLLDEIWAFDDDAFGMPSTNVHPERPVEVEMKLHSCRSIIPSACEMLVPFCQSECNAK